MKTLVREIKAYQFNELSENAKDTAKQNYLTRNNTPEFFSEDLKMELSDKFGLSNLKTYFSLSYSQGDGLCLYGQISRSELFSNEKFKRIAFKNIHHKQIQSVYNVLERIDFIHRSRYCYANSVKIESQDDMQTEKQEDIINEIISNIKTWYSSFCNEWENRGYEYVYDISDEALTDGCQYRDYWFTHEGEILDMDEYNEAV
jgi:hypothetical protein